MIGMKKLVLRRLAYVLECLRFLPPMVKLIPPTFEIKRKHYKRRQLLRVEKILRKMPNYSRRGIRHK